jgi:hypothetical protein
MYDSIKPALTATLEKEFVTGAVVVKGTASDTDLDHYRCDIYKSEGENPQTINLPSDGTKYTDSVTDGTLCSINVESLADGEYYVRLWATDKAGNSIGNNGSDTVYLHFVKDATFPALSKITVNGVEISFNKEIPTEIDKADKYVIVASFVDTGVGILNITILNQAGNWITKNTITETNLSVDTLYTVATNASDKLANKMTAEQRELLGQGYFIIIDDTNNGGDDSGDEEDVEPTVAITNATQTGAVGTIT